jgi:hypothetical protein
LNCQKLLVMLLSSGIYCNLIELFYLRSLGLRNLLIYFPNFNAQR